MRVNVSRRTRPRSRTALGQIPAPRRAYSEKTVLDLVGLIYDAAGNPALWPAFLERLGAALNSTVATIYAHDTRRNLGGISAQVGFDPAYVRAYYSYYISKNVYMIRGKHLAAARDGLRQSGAMPGSRSQADRVLP